MGEELVTLRAIAFGTFFVLGACATEVRESQCSCELARSEAGLEEVAIAHREETYKKRPILDKIFDAIGGVLGLLGF